MKKIITTLFAVIMTFNIAWGQTQATTESGKKVILNPDGTWKYTDTLKFSQNNLDPNDCSNWIKKEEDKVTGKSYTSMKGYLIVSKNSGKKGFGITLMLSGQNSIIFTIKAVGASACINKSAKINILFTDQTRIELTSDTDFNCKGNVTVYFGDVFGKKNQLLDLQTKKIDIMRVWTSDGYVEEQFEDAQAEQLKNSFNCLLK